MKRLIMTAAIALAMQCAAATDYLAGLTPYQPQQNVSGRIRVWGNPYIPELMQAWQDGFRAIHPGVTFDTNMKGTEAAMAGLYAAIADIVFFGREPYQPELDAFRDWFGYDATGVKITSGSYATQHKTFALMVYVHKDNPLAGLSLKQLDALYGAERRRGAKGPVRTWGDLGLTGAWARRPVHVYGYDFDTGMAGFLRKTVLKDSYRWNPELKDYRNGRTATGDVINAGTYILQKLAQDPDGIGYANLLFENPGVRSIALRDEEQGAEPVPPTIDNAWRRSYPLTRYSTAFVNRVPGQPIDPKVREFIRYILSREGMAAVVHDAAFLPLNNDAIRAELHNIE